MRRRRFLADPLDPLAPRIDEGGRMQLADARALGVALRKNLLQDV